MVPQTVAKIAICNCLVALIAKLANAGGVYLVGNGRLVTTGTRPNLQHPTMQLNIIIYKRNDLVVTIFS